MDTGGVTVVVAPTLTTSRGPAAGLVIDRSTTNPAMTAIAAAVSTTTVVAGAPLSPSLTERRGRCWPSLAAVGSVTWWHRSWSELSRLEEVGLVHVRVRPKRSLGEGDASGLGLGAASPSRSSR